MRSQLMVELWRASFRCSHISHAMFYSFLSNSAIHCWLDFHIQNCFHIWSWWSHHAWLSQPSQRYCLPMASCSAKTVGCSDELVFGVFQVHKYSIRYSHRARSVPSSLSQVSNYFSDFSHRIWVVGAGQVRMWCLSSCGTVHCRHCIEDWNCHHCIFFPIAKCPNTYLETQWWWLIGSSCSALLIESQWIVFQIPWERFHLFPQ